MKMNKEIDTSNLDIAKEIVIPSNIPTMGEWMEIMDDMVTAIKLNKSPCNIICKGNYNTSCDACPISSINSNLCNLVEDASTDIIIDLIVLARLVIHEINIKYSHYNNEDQYRVLIVMLSAIALEYHDCKILPVDDNDYRKVELAHMKKQLKFILNNDKLVNLAHISEITKHILSDNT